MKYINEIPVMFILISLVCYILIKLIYIKVLKQNLNLVKEITIVTLIAYVESLLYLTLYPTATFTSNIASVNLVPFKTIHLYMNFQGDISLQIINLIGNVVVFIPIGIFALILLKKVTFYRVFLIGLGSTFFIEIMQLFLSINGINSRSFDVDDLLLNTIGVLIGYSIGIIIKKIFSKQSIEFTQ